MEEITKEKENFKACGTGKNLDKLMQKIYKNDKKPLKIEQIDKMTSEDQQLYVWVRTFLSVHDILPNIIKLVDSTVSKKAMSLVDSSYIFGDHQHGTYNQIEKILEISERKVSLINLYKIIDTMVNSLSGRLKEFAKLKFFKRKKTEYLADEFGIDERTVYRWSNKVMDNLVAYCKSQNWTVRFIYSQIEREGWLLEHYKKYYKKLLPCESAIL